MEDFKRGAALHHAPCFHHHHVAAQLQRFLGFRRGVHHRGITYPQQLQQLGAQFFAQLVIQIHQRFIEQQ